MVSFRYAPDTSVENLSKVMRLWESSQLLNDETATAVTQGHMSAEGLTLAYGHVMGSQHLEGGVSQARSSRSASAT